MFDPENQEQLENLQADEYVDSSEIAEEVADDYGPGPEDQNEDDYDNENDNLDENDIEMDGDTLEIDLANNSWTYFDQHKDSVFVVFRHPTLPMVVTGGGDNTAYLWTTHTQPPRFVGELQGHKESVISGGFTGDGNFVITADMNGCVLVHQASKGGQKWTRFAELEEVEEVLWIAVHPKLPYFAFGAPDGSVWVFQIDAATKSLQQVMSGFSHSAECNGGVFVHTEDHEILSLVTVAEDGTIVNWNCFAGVPNYKLQPYDDFRGVESPWVSVSTHGNVFAAGARDGQLAIVNLDSGRLVHQVKTLENVDDVADLSVEALAWCSSGTVNLLAVGLVSGDVLLFESLQWRLRRTLKVDDTITKLAFVDDTPVLVGASMNGKVYKWDARTGEELFVGVGHNMGVLDFAILDKGAKIVTAGDEGVSLVFAHE